MTALVQGLPALVMLGGALLALLRLPIPVRAHRWVPILTCLLAGICLVGLGRTVTAPVVVFEPNEALPALSITLQWNGVALPFGLFFLLILSGRLCFGIEEDTRAFTFGALAAGAGALLFLAADNWTTLAVAWLVVEVGMLAVPAEEGDSHGAMARAFGWNLVAIVAWVTAGMVLSNQASSLRLEEMALSGSASFLILLAIWIRGGIYPFHAASPATLTSIGIRIGLPLLLGGYMMSRFLSQSQGGMTFAPETQVLVLFAVGATALIVVGQPHGGEALTWTLRALGATLLLLPFFVNARMSPSVSAWFALGGFAVCVFVELAMQWRAELPRLRLGLFVWIAALVMVACLPLAPLFWSRVGLLASAYAQVGIAIWLLLVATMSLLLVPVWREIFASSQVAPKAPILAEYAALALVLLPAVAVGIAPGMFVAPFGTRTLAGSNLVYAALFQPLSTFALIFLIAGLAVPLLASFELARRWAPRANLVPSRLSSVLDLSDLAVLLDGVYRLVRALVQQSLALLEQPPIAWLIFLAIWVAIWVIGLSG